jgi:polar amino acid transport system ATP-binding protein
MRFAEEISDVVVFTENGLIVDKGSPEDIFQKSVNPRIRRFVNGLASARASLEDGEGI